MFFGSLALLWVHAIRTIYIDSGLFWWVGTDFGQYYGQAMALWSGDSGNIYRPESYSHLYQDLLSRYIVNQEPVPPTSVPYPPIFAWLFTPFTIPSPPVGFLLWECLNALAAVYLAWRATRLFPVSTRPMVGLLILTSYPNDFSRGPMVGSIGNRCAHTEVYAVHLLERAYDRSFLTFALLGCFISLLFTVWRCQQEQVSWQQVPHAPAV